MGEAKGAKMGFETVVEIWMGGSMAGGMGGSMAGETPIPAGGQQQETMRPRVEKEGLAKGWWRGALGGGSMRSWRERQHWWQGALQISRRRCSSAS